MKIRLLSDIDLARIAPQDRDLKRRSLEQIRFGRPPFSYRPFRACLGDIFNLQPEMFAPAQPTALEIIERNIRRESRSALEEEHNLRVARGLHAFASDKGVESRSHEFFPMQIVAGGKVTLWQSFVLGLNGKALVPFIEPRRSRGLGVDGRRFAFSMMHERIRAADEDFAAVGLCIIQFGEGDDDTRPVKLHTDTEVALYALDELENMVAETYEIWREVCEGREDETRRRAGGVRGPLI